jgi:hypothetical protein
MDIVIRGFAFGAAALCAALMGLEQYREVAKLFGLDIGN